MRVHTVEDVVVVVPEPIFLFHSSVNVFGVGFGEVGLATVEAIGNH